KHFLKTVGRSPINDPVPLWNVGKAKYLRDKTTVSYYWDTVRRTMTCLCGISRNSERLHAANEVLSSVRKNIHDFYWNYRVSKDFLEVRNIADVAMVIVESALARKESRACHFREDFKHEEDRHFHGITIVRKGNAAQVQDVQHPALEA